MLLQMFTLILIGIVAFVVCRHKDEIPWDEIKNIFLIQGKVSAYEIGESKYGQQRTFSEGGGTSVETRSVDMEIEFHVPWGQWDPHAIENLVFDPPKLRTPWARRYFGPMDMEVGEDQIVIYDLELGQFDLVTERAKFFQTVISIKPPELRLPPFIIRPKGILFYGEPLAYEQVIKSDALLDAGFYLESLTPHRTKALFESTFGTEVLIPFLNDRQWTVQWTGNSLIVYQWNHLIDPERLHEVALEVSEFFELLKSAPEVIDRIMKEFIQETAQQTKSRYVTR